MLCKILVVANCITFFYPQDLYDKADKLPNFDSLQCYEDSGKICKTNYSDPGYFMELWKTEFEQAAKKERKEKRRRKKERLANKKKEPKRKVITKLNHIETRIDRARKKLEAEGNPLYQQMRQVSVIIENLSPIPEMNEVKFGTPAQSVPAIDPIREDIFNRISRSSVVVPDNNVDISNLPIPEELGPKCSSPMTGPTPPAPPAPVPPVYSTTSPAPPPPPPIMQAK